MSKSSVLIATPAYGGNFTLQYLESIERVTDYLGAQQIPVGTYYIQNESLITRARNTCATLALRKSIDKLFFIDADVGFTKEDFARIYWSEKDIIGGLYPHKAYPLDLNFNPLKKHITGPVKFSEHVSKFADDKGELEVENVATGFLSISLSVLAKLSSVVETYTSEHMNGQAETYYDFFGCGPYRGRYETEDWRFCRLAKEAGFSVHINPKVILTHTGTHTFRFEDTL